MSAAVSAHLRPGNLGQLAPRLDQLGAAVGVEHGAYPIFYTHEPALLPINAECFCVPVDDFVMEPWPTPEFFAESAAAEASRYGTYEDARQY